MNEPDRIRVTGLWQRATSAGLVLSGVLKESSPARAELIALLTRDGDVELAIWANKRRQSDRDPDFTVFAKPAFQARPPAAPTATAPSQPTARPVMGRPRLAASR